MLKPSECFAGPISAATGMTLVMPRSENEKIILLVKSDEKLFAVFLNADPGTGKFPAFECGNNDYWNGLHIPNVTIELDETALCKERYDTPFGSMTRTGNKLVVQARVDSWPAALTVLDGLPSCSERQSACFLKWQIVLGDGDSKRVLYRVDVGA